MLEYFCLSSARLVTFDSAFFLAQQVSGTLSMACQALLALRRSHGRQTMPFLTQLDPPLVVDEYYYLAL